MFYKHLHDPSCDLFMRGEEAPQSKEAQLQAALDAEREKVKGLEEQLRLANCDQVNTENDLNDVTAQLATLQAQLRRVEGERNTARHRVDGLEAREIDVEILQGDNARLLAAIDEGLTGAAINLAVRTVEEMYADNAALRLKVKELVEAIYRDLPTRRDWLDPALEARMKAALQPARG